MLAAVFFMSAFLFSSNVQAAEEVSSFEALKDLLTAPDAPEELEITISADMEILSQIEVSSNIKTLTIDGSDNTLNGGGSSAFLKAGSIDLTLRNITIENCTADDGAVIYAEADTNIALENSSFTNNIAEQGSGGVVYQEGGSEDTVGSNTLTIKNCTFTGNGDERTYGGVVYQGQYAQISISDSSFTDNYSEEHGGAIYQGDHCRMVITGATFKENISNYSGGGAIYQDIYSSLTISDAAFSENTAYDQGGAVYQGEYSELNVSGSLFSGNKSDERGGAICQKEGAVMTLQDCQFLDNESDEGGAINAPTSAEVTGTGSETCLFSGNKAGSYGGALSYGQDLTVTGCTFKENEAYAGGALASHRDRIFLESRDEEYYFTQDYLVGTAVISDSHFIENQADAGGAWYESTGFDEDTFDEDTYVYYDEDEKKYYYLTIEELRPVIIVNPDGSETRITEPGIPLYFDEPCGTKITVSGTEFKDNKANVNGGVLFRDSLQTTEIREGNVFSGNAAPNGKGGVIYNNGKGELTVSGSEFTQNSAGETDAICYSTTDGTVSFDENTFTGNTVESDDGWVFSLNGNTTITNNDFFANTDTLRDMLFADASGDDEISGNTYRGNFLEDAFSSPDPDTEVEYSPEIEVSLDLREVYQDYVRDGAVRISINGNVYGDFEVTDGKTVIKINESDLENGVNDIKAEYISDEYNEGEYTEGYYHYQQPELTFKIRKTEEPQPPKPIWPCCELPRTGITGAGISPANKPASLNYDLIGMELYIPEFDLVSDIVTVPLTDDGYPVEWLGKDAGLLEGFAKPGSGISVIAGHNTLNAEEYGPFARLNTLEVGDVLFVRSSNGELMRFTVYLNEKIGAEDIEGLQRAAGMYENTLTLMTCEDELAEGGYASRRIVSAK